MRFRRRISTLQPAPMHHPILLAGCDCTTADCHFACDVCGADFGRHPATELPHICPEQFPDAPPFIPYTPPPPPPVAAPAPSPPTVYLPGQILTGLLGGIGLEYTPDCLCNSQAALMDAGQTTREATVEVMRVEAARRGLPFVESQARWLVDLAHTLAAERRQPTRLENLRLRAMRVGVSLLSRESDALASQSPLGTQPR